MAKAVKKTAKKTAKKSAKKGVKKTAKKAATTSRTRDDSKVEEAIKLMKRAKGATLADFAEIGFNQPAQAAVKAAEKRGLKVSQNKPEGERTHYMAA